MNGQQFFFLVCAVFLGIVMLTLCVKTGKPLRAFLGTAVPGTLSLVAINYASFFTGVGLALNVCSIFTAVFLGIPGVITIFVLKLLWGIA